MDKHGLSSQRDNPGPSQDSYIILLRMMGVIKPHIHVKQVETLHVLASSPDSLT